MIKNENGQSTIEFIFCFIFGVSMILLIFNSAMNHAAGYLTHYATFMASRVYLTKETYSGQYGAGGIGNAADVAQGTFDLYQLGVFGVNSNLVINPPTNSGPGDYLVVGAYTQFQKRIDFIGQITGQNEVNLISESYLGKEPTRGVCAARVCSAVLGLDSCDEGMDITLFDDGC